MKRQSFSMIAKRMVLLFIGSTFTSVTFMNCSQGFKVIEGEMELLSSALNVELKFDEGSQDVMTSVNPRVSFSVQASDSSYVLKCFVNAVEMTTCVSPLNLSTMQDGDISVRIVAQNNNGRMLKEISRVFKLDRNAPAITVTSKPADQIGAQNTSVAFSVIDNISSAADIVVQCALDTAAFGACTSPQAYANLAAGAHSIKIKAFDKAGNASAETSVNFSVVIGIPTVVISQAPASFINVKTASFTFSGTSSNSTITGYECSVNGGTTFAACTSPQAYANLADGVYNFAVRAKDALNQTSGAATNRFTVDTTLPSTPVVSSNLMSPTSQVALSLTFSSTDASGIANYQCSVDAGAFAACTSPRNYSALTAGSHTFKVKSADQAGNASLEGSYTITIDNVAPVLNITAQPTNPTTEKTASFTFTATDTPAGIKTLECQLDTEATYSNCTSPKAYTVVVKGNRTFAVRATDNAGNTVVKSYAWVVNDVMEPPVQLSGAQLYANNCASCHGQLSVSVKKDRSVAQILNALNDPVTGMGVLKPLLTQADIEAISAALKSVAPPETSELASQDPLTVNRYFVTSVFNDIFTNPGNGLVYTDISSEIEKWVFSQTTQFGGGCDVNSSASGQDCGPTFPWYHGATLLYQYVSVHLAGTPIQLPVSTVRQSYTLKACENIGSVTASMNYLRTRLGVAATAEIDAKNITDMYLLFFRDEPPSAELLKALQDLNNDLKTNNENLEDRWRAMFSTVCELPGWQSI